MINTITLAPYIEKRVRGEVIDHIYFEPEVTTYTIGGVGLRVNVLLKSRQIESKAYFLSPANIAGFLKEECAKQGIAHYCVEGKGTGAIHSLLLNEEEKRLAQEKEEKVLEETQVELFRMLLAGEIQKEDVNVFSYPENTLSQEVFFRFYQTLYEAGEVMLCDIHPEYYEILKTHPADVLVLDEKQYLAYRHVNVRMPLSDTISFIQEEMKDMAKIIVYALAYNDFLFFMEGQVYRAVCMVKLEDARIYKEAILSGIVKCYSEDGDIHALSKECLLMSVGSALEEGLHQPSLEMLSILEEKISFYQI